jgi:hypothetical protein
MNLISSVLSCIPAGTTRKSNTHCVKFGSLHSAYSLFLLKIVPKGCLWRNIIKPMFSYI